MGSRDKPAITAVQNITIYKQVNIELAGEQPRGEGDGSASFLKAGDGLKIQSDGSFHYEVAESRMTFEDQVRVTQPVADEQKNWMTCEFLVVTFDRDEQRPMTDAAALPGLNTWSDGSPQARRPNKRIQSAIWVSRQARLSLNPKNLGSHFHWVTKKKKVVPVVFVSEQHDLRAEASELKYDAVDRLIHSARPREAKIRQGVHEPHSPSCDGS